MIRRAVLGVVAIAAMAVPATALGGGFTTVGLRELPTDVQAGVSWAAEFTVLSHGRTPAPGLRPVVTIARADGTGRRTFTATETGHPGGYRANVVFPSDGSWSMRISEWQGSPGHTFGTVDVGGAGRPSAGSTGSRTEPATPDRNGPWGALAAALAAGLLAGAAASVLQRRRAPGPV
jgi:hypothetical protein